METVTLILATYYVATALVYFDAPFGIFARLRSHIKPLNCFSCTSLYVSMLASLALADSLSWWLVLSFAGAGGALVIERFLLSHID